MVSSILLRSVLAGLLGLLFIYGAIAAPIAISSIQTLSFGKFAAGSGGTVTIAPRGARSKTGGVTLLSTASGSPAKFTVTGDPGQVFSITLPLDGQVALVSGGQSMAMNGFASDPAGSAVLEGGVQTLWVGATLSVDPAKPPADYSGTFSITVDYQ